jgi:UDP-2,4-diacetamido-2,4,6-trideoxy-beta-L-altropyranose hydrolase
MTAVLIRADASAVIGAGHVMRCLAVAEALLETGVAVTLAAADLPDALRRRLTEAGVGVTDIPGPAGGAEDLQAAIAAVKNAAAVIAAVILDGYQFDETYRRSLRAAAAGAPVLAFDDTGDLADLCADIVVNAAPDADKLGYGAKAPGATLLLGPAFAPIRRDIRLAAALPPSPWAERSRILLTFGGADPLGLTGPTLARLAELLPEAEFDVAVGGADPRAEAVRALGALLESRVAVHVDHRDMGGLMRRAGLAVAAAGGTTGELAALETPTLLVTAADNQAGAAASARAGGVPVVEARRGDPAAAALDIAEAAADLWRDPARRQEIAAALRGKVDGQGALRIAAALLERIAQSSS